MGATRVHTVGMRRLVSILLPLPFLVAAACSSASPASPRDREPAPTSGPAGVAATAFTPWSTYHHSPDRAGNVSHGPSGALKVGWTKDLRGAVYGEPLVVGDTLVVSTEENRVYGLDARTGAVTWSTDLGPAQPRSGLPCGNIDPLGVTGTPAYDPETKQVFVAAETRGGEHTLWAIDPTDGSKRWHRNLDTLPDRNRLAEQQRGALLVTPGGWSRSSAGWRATATTTWGTPRPCRPTTGARPPATPCRPRARPASGRPPEPWPPPRAWGTRSWSPAATARS